MAQEMLVLREGFANVIMGVFELLECRSYNRE